MKSKSRYSIKTASKLTGLSEFLIRAWETRYNAVKPERSTSKRRLFSDEDIEKLKLLKQLRSKGYNISSIAGMDLDELRRLTEETFYPEKSQVSPEGSVNIEKIQDNLINAIKSLDPQLLEKLLSQAAIDLSLPDLLEKLISPLLNRIGEMWQSGEIRISHEHLASRILQKFLLNLVSSNSASGALIPIVTGSLKGQVHEMGALVISAAAAAEGFRVIYLGADLPAEDIISACIQSTTRVIALSFTFPENDPNLAAEIEKFKILVPQVTVIAGGTAVESYAPFLKNIGAFIIRDLNSFRNLLKKIRNLRDLSAGI